MRQSNKWKEQWKMKLIEMEDSFWDEWFLPPALSFSDLSLIYLLFNILGLSLGTHQSLKAFM